MRVECLKCHELVEVDEANEFTRAFGVVCRDCRARYSEPPRGAIEPAVESAPGSYEDATDLLTASSRHPDLDPVAPARAPPPVPRAAKLPGAVDASAVPSKKRPSFWISDEDSAGPLSSRDPRVPPAPNSAIQDLRSIVPAPPSRPPRRRFDEELIRLGGVLDNATMSPLPAPVTGAALARPEAGFDRCPHCGERLDEAHADRARLGTEPVIRTDPPPRKVTTNPPVASERRSRPPTSGAPAPPPSLTPWAVAAASLVVAFSSFASRHPTSNEVPAATPESAAASVRLAAQPAAVRPEPSRAAPSEPEVGSAPAEPANAAVAEVDPGPKPEARDRTASEPKAPSDARAARTQPAGGAAAPFDRAAAVAALSAAAGQGGGCRKAGDPTGIARVTVTFAPSGRATQAQISGPPFAGTATGSCLARVFRQASVPPFSGDPISASKTVSIH